MAVISQKIKFIKVQHFKVNSKFPIKSISTIFVEKQKIFKSDLLIENQRQSVTHIHISPVVIDNKNIKII